MIKQIALISILSLLVGCYEDDTVYVPLEAENVVISRCEPEQDRGNWVNYYNWYKATYEITNGVVTQEHKTECMKVY